MSIANCNEEFKDYLRYSENQNQVQVKVDSCALGWGARDYTLRIDGDKIKGLTDDEYNDLAFNVYMDFFNSMIDDNKLLYGCSFNIVSNEREKLSFCIDWAGKDVGKTCEFETVCRFSPELSSRLKKYNLKYCTFRAEMSEEELKEYEKYYPECEFISQSN